MVTDHIIHTAVTDGRAQGEVAADAARLIDPGGGGR
jgi:hypothetical protein